MRAAAPRTAFAGGPGWALLGLNAEVFGTGGEEEAAQEAWLEERLAGCSTPIGLFLHKPWFRETIEDDEPVGRYVPIAIRRKLATLFKGHDLRLIATGHTHQLREHHADGVQHLWVPSTAFVVPDAMQPWIGTKLVGFILLTLDDDIHRTELVTPPGMRHLDLADYTAIFPKVAVALGGAAT